MTTVALTGATGFIGKTLLRQLAEQGFQVRALYRPASPPSPKFTDAALWQAGDLADGDSLRALVAGVDAIVHCAGTVRGTTLEQFKKVNTDGVARLLEAATAQKVSHFLLMSSLAAREPSLSSYALSKKLGEDVLWRHQGRMTMNILRPPAVYGPGDREIKPLLQLIKRGIVPVIGRDDARFSLLYVNDLAAAVCRLLKSEQAETGRCFELHDGHPGGYSWQQIAVIASHLNGKKPYCCPIPRLLMQALGTVNAALAHLLGYQPMLTPGKVREIFHPDWVCDNRDISGAIDWQPQVLFQDGMKYLHP